jgi:hypothetical protein
MAFALPLFQPAAPADGLVLFVIDRRRRWLQAARAEDGAFQQVPTQVHIDRRPPKSPSPCGLFFSLRRISG